MRILLTGGTGFIGQNIVAGLKHKYLFYVPSHHELDLLDTQHVSDYIKANEIDMVIHSAVGRGPTLYEDTLMMFGNLIRHLGRLDKFIYLGSGAEFAKNRDLNKVTEEQIGQFIPQDPYGLAKYICNGAIRDHKKMLNLRLFGIYGRYEKYLYKFISNAITKVIYDMDIEIMQDVLFDYLYVADFVRIIDHFIENGAEYPDYNITPSESSKISDIAGLINQAAGKNVPIKVTQPNLNFAYTGSNARLLQAIPDFKFTSYADGINDLYQYYLSIADELDKDALQVDQYKKNLVLRK